MPVETCVHCGQAIINSTSILHNDRVYCPVCHEDLFFKCDRCYVYHLKYENMFTFNNKQYCGSCYNQAVGECTSCGEDFHRSNICCYGGDDYCRTCYYERFASCQNCGETVSVDDVCYDSDNDIDLCRSCYDGQRQQAYLHHYDYRPDNYNYYRGEGESKNSDHSKNLYFGIELEVENINYTDVESIAENLPDFVYLKEDGSIDDGFEIVSHPTTYQWLKENAEQWLKILNISKQGFRSYKTETCGIHIHLSKNYFSTLHLYKFLSLFYKPENTEFILRISQRTQRKFDSWASVKDNGGDKSLVYKAKNKRGNYERFTAVNLQNEHTIEIRIFRGTLNPRSFWKNIEFLQAVIDFTANASLNKIDEPNFLTYIYDKKSLYINLWNWLWDKGFYEKSLLEDDKLCV